MEIIRGLHNLRPCHHGCVATIGNFDGVHLGHQQVLGQLAEKSAEYGVPTTIITFEPQPQEWFSPERAPPRLTRFREKVDALRRYTVDKLLCLRFNQALGEMTAEAFIEEVLVKGLGIRYLVVGDDFRFGQGRRGDFAMLHQAGIVHHFPVASMHTFLIDHQRVSSTRVRQALAQGQLDEAAKLLGRPYRLCGRVAHGDKRGRQLGFPTANLFLRRHAIPISGVYGVELFGLMDEPLPGVANIGLRPTIGGNRPLLEVHLLDFTGDIYGYHVEVDFLYKIREERRFPSLADLTQQIHQDIQQARGFFAEQRAC